MIYRWKNDPEHHQEGVVPPPRDPNAPGELGKAVKFDNPDPETKKLIDAGWKNNAFNQVLFTNYVCCPMWEGVPKKP